MKATANDNDRIIFSIVKEPLHGKLLSFNPSSGKITYLPNTDFAGHDKFIFKATDPRGGISNESQVLINIKPINGNSNNNNNNNNDANNIVETSSSSSSGDVESSGSSTNDLSSQPSKSSSSQESHESKTSIGNDNGNNNVKREDNIPPTTYDQTVVIEQNYKAKISLKATANDNDRIIFSIVKEPLYGKLLSFNPSSGKITYLPNTDFAGHDKFIFKATDPRGGISNESQVLINIKPINGNSNNNNNNNNDANNIVETSP